MQSKNILFFFFATLHIFSKLLFGNIIKNLIKLSVLNTKKKRVMLYFTLLVHPTLSRLSNGHKTFILEFYPVLFIKICRKNPYYG